MLIKTETCQHNAAHPVLCVNFIKWFFFKVLMHKLLKRTDWPLLCGETTAFIFFSCASVNSGLFPLMTQKTLISHVAQLCTCIGIFPGHINTFKLFCSVCPIITHETYRTVISYNSPVVFVKTLDKPLAWNKAWDLEPGWEFTERRARISLHR